MHVTRCGVCCATVAGTTSHEGFTSFETNLGLKSVDQSATATGCTHNITDNTLCSVLSSNSTQINKETHVRTCSRPSSVLGIVTHFDACSPWVVMANINPSSSSRFSFNFLTKLSIAFFGNGSFSSPFK